MSFSGLSIFGFSLFGAWIIRSKSSNSNNRDTVTNTEDINEALKNALADRQVDKVKNLIKRGADINTVENIEDINRALIFESSCYTNYSFIESLLKYKNIDINVKSMSGDTALINASKYGARHIVELLLEHKASLDIQNNDGMTALMYAIYNYDVRVVELLCEAGADINIQNYSGHTVIDIVKQPFVIDIAEHKTEYNIYSEQNPIVKILRKRESLR